jgi:nucleotide-binding universal stress UspA family protein
MKILWAVDIFENHPKAIKASMSFLKSLSRNMQIKVDAVTVIHHNEYAIESKEASLFKEKNLDIFRSNLSKALKQDWFGKPIILLETQAPQRVAALNLTEFAKKNNYDAILIVKHSHASRRSNYLGSFAEMITFLSAIPIFLINPDGLIPKKIDNIIVAIDDTSEKEKEFKELIRFFPINDTFIKLFHRTPIPFYYLFKESIKQYVNDQIQIISNSLQSVKLIAENAKASVELDIKGSSKNIGDAILSEAKRNNFELIITIHRGKEAPGFFLGRITRKILQKTDRPVLLFRP